MSNQIVRHVEFSTIDPPLPHDNIRYMRGYLRGYMNDPLEALDACFYIEDPTAFPFKPGDKVKVTIEIDDDQPDLGLGA